MRYVAVLLTVLLLTTLCVADETEPDTTTITISKPVLVKGPTGWARSVAFSPDGKRLAVGESHRTLWLFDTQTWKKRGSVTLPRGKG